MGNSGIDGTLSIFGVGARDGFTVEVHRLGWFADTLLGSTVTDAAGRYSVRYEEGPTLGHDLQVRLYDVVHRLIVESDVQEAINVPVWTVDLSAFAGQAHGWIPQLQVFLTDGNQVELLVDNELAWGRLTDEVALAQESVDLSQLTFEVKIWPWSQDMVTRFTPDPPTPGGPATGVRVQERMKAVAAAGRRVRLLLNDFIGLPFAFDTFFRNTWYFKDSAVLVRGFERWLRDGAMHAKACVIDRQTYYSVGSPLMQEYFDGRRHRIDEPRRGTMSKPFNAIQLPIHDVSARIAGPHAEVVAGVYEGLWTKSALSPPAPPFPTGTGIPVQAVLTLPGNTFDGAPEGVTGIVEAYLRALRYAEDFFYIENQYLTEPSIGVAVVRAMKARPALQVIMLLNPKLDLPWYTGWQDRVIAQILADLGPDAGRVGFFSLWTHETSGGMSRIIRNYVHSKVAVADRSWATVGSANLDGASLTTSQFVLWDWDPRRDVRAADWTRRAIEMNAVFYSSVQGLQASPVPDEMRRSLWAEHLGYDSPNHPDLVTRPADGWLGLWRRTAARKLASLNVGPPTVDPARVLEGPFGRPSLPELELDTDEEFLVRCGVATGRLPGLGVLDHVRSYDLDTGEWSD